MPGNGRSGRRKGKKDGLQKHQSIFNEQMVLESIKQIERTREPGNPFQPCMTKEIRKQVSSITGMSQPTLHKYLNILVDKGKIHKVGRGLYSSALVSLVKKLGFEFIITKEYQLVSKLERDIRQKIIEEKSSYKMIKQDNEYENEEYSFHRHHHNSKTKDNTIEEIVRIIDSIEKCVDIYLFSSSSLNFITLPRLHKAIYDEVYDLITSEELRSALENEEFSSDNYRFHLFATVDLKKGDFKLLDRKKVEVNRLMREIFSNISKKIKANDPNFMQETFSGDIPEFWQVQDKN
jgi:hypothetical protein